MMEFCILRNEFTYSVVPIGDEHTSGCTISNMGLCPLVIMKPTMEDIHF